MGREQGGVSLSGWLEGCIPVLCWCGIILPPQQVVVLHRTVQRMMRSEHAGRVYLVAGYEDSTTILWMVHGILAWRSLLNVPARCSCE